MSRIAVPLVLILCRDCRRVRDGRRWIVAHLPATAEKIPALLCPDCSRARDRRRTA